VLYRISLIIRTLKIIIARISKATAPRRRKMQPYDNNRNSLLLRSIWIDFCATDASISDSLKNEYLPAQVILYIFYIVINVELILLF